MSKIEATAEARYKVAEVCRLADVQPYVLKYWESEFPVLSTPKGASGPRLYNGLELKIIERIKKLLYDEGYTIAGAKKRLESEASGRSEAKDVADTNPAVLPIAELPKPPRAEKAEKPEKPRPPRPGKPPAPTFVDVSSVEAQAPEVTQPVESAAAKGPADDRVARAVADLKEILALLSRAEP